MLVGNRWRFNADSTSPPKSVRASIEGHAHAGGLVARGKVAIVTGAARGGIGEAYAHALAGAGAAIVSADINVDGARAVADAIADEGGKALAVAVDIVDEGSVRAMVGETLGQFGGVDILVNNAALMVQIVGTPAMEYTRADWDRAFGVNVTGAWQCAKAVAPSMRERGGGRIVTGQVLNVDGGFIMRR